MSRRSTKQRRSARRWKERYALREELLKRERAARQPQLRPLFKWASPAELLESWSAYGQLSFFEARDIIYGKVSK